MRKVSEWELDPEICGACEDFYQDLNSPNKSIDKENFSSPVKHFMSFSSNQGLSPDDDALRKIDNRKPDLKDAIKTDYVTLVRQQTK